MTTKVLFEAIDGIDQAYIAEAEKPLHLGVKKQRQRWIAACACAALALCIGVALPTVLAPADEDPQKQIVDVNFGFRLNGRDYQPMDTVDHARYPALHVLQFSGTREQINEIFESTFLGEQIATVPADENFGQGTVYRVLQYPQDDSILILYRDGAYGFYVSEGNT